MSTPFNYKWLEPGAAVPVDIETTAALVNELARWEAAYNAVCDERDAIAKDSDKAYALLRQSLSALELLKASPNIGIWVDTADEAIDAIKEFLE